MHRLLLALLFAVSASASAIEVAPDAANADIVKITAVASDDVGVTSMKLLIDGVVRSTCGPCTEIAYNWNLRKVAPGEHTIRVEARDAAGNSGFDQITVTRR